MEPTDENRSAGAAEASVEVRHPLPVLAASGFPVVAAGPAETVSFDRQELREILDLYARKVAEGEWRDYALDFSAQQAVFSIYRRSSEFALYRIVKAPRLARKQGAYSVVTTTGLILKRGHELGRVLAVLDKKLKVVPD